MKNYIIIIVLSILAVCIFGWIFTFVPKTVGKTIKEEDFKEFYYTYSTTVNPPEYQRYRIFIKNGKRMFYHEKREGDSVFLAEEDITVSVETELSPEEWAIFWRLISGGTVKKRKDNVTSGGSGPWLYLYWNGDLNKYQEYKFADAEKEAEFEEFCAKLVSG